MLRQGIMFCTNREKNCSCGTFLTCSATDNKSGGTIFVPDYDEDKIVFTEHVLQQTTIELISERFRTDNKRIVSVNHMTYKTKHNVIVPTEQHYCMTVNRKTFSRKTSVYLIKPGLT